MSGRTAGALLLLAGTGVWLGVAAPSRRRTDRARADFASARQERDRLRAQVAAAERRGAVAGTPEAQAAATRDLRASLLRATVGIPVGSVQIAAGSERGPAPARGRLSAEGRMADVLRLADRLVGPGSGVLVQQVTLSAVARPGRREIRLELEAVGAGPVS